MRTLFSVVIVVLLAMLAAPTAAAQAADGWRPFEGTWSASGRRHSIPTETGRAAGVLQMSGAIVLARVEGLSLGFRAEAIGFDDGQSLSVGRAVWTDERGDQIFSQLKGERVKTGGRATGTITGGTGRYAGIEGEYVFEWQYVVHAEDEVVQGLAVRLSGRFRPPAVPE
ncbi:MAG: hypothetical protein KBD01_01825 [Acidobacteria bacterium]|nr:hypothetical protein [Acidobacteriota bacterium]